MQVVDMVASSQVKKISLLNQTEFSAVCDGGFSMLCASL